MFNPLKALEQIYSENGLTSQEKNILAYFVRRSDQEGKCWPSYALIAKECSISRQWAIKLVQSLAADGIIEVNQENGHNTYTLTGKFSLPSQHSLPSKEGLLVNTVDQDSKHSLPGVVNTVDPNLSTLNLHNELHITSEVSSNEKETLNTLKTVPNYPFDYEKDLRHIRTLAVDFPKLDLLAEAKNWSTYKLDKPLKPKANARLQFRHWCQIANDRASPPGPTEKHKDDPLLRKYIEMGWVK